MACRPAGMSDDETADEDACFTSYTSPKDRSSNRWSAQSCDTNGSPAGEKNIASNDERESQFRALSACMSGDLNVIEDYIKAGHNVNDYLHTGWTLLLYGASSVLPEVVELLLKHGAKPGKNKDGYTPLMAVCDSTRGTEEKCLQCILILLNAKANPNTRNKLMKTPLMFACKSRESIVVAELLKHVKDIDAVDSDGQTALHYAAASNKPEIVKLLLKSNASTTITDHREFTAKDIALAKGYDKVVALLDHEENSEIETFCDLTRRNEWSDMFNEISENSDLLDNDIAEILYGMGLECYKPLFKGVKLKNFMKITDEELVALGMDIAAHRKQFMDNLHKFHTRAWSVRSIGSFNTYMPFTLYDGVALLGNAARQIRVIGSSFEFIKNGLRRAGTRGDRLTDTQRADYTVELNKTEKNLLTLKSDLRRILKLAKNSEIDNRDITPADYIDGRKRRRHNWTIIIGVVLMTGMYLSKTSLVQRFWNN